MTRLHRPRHPIPTDAEIEERLAHFFANDQAKPLFMRSDVDQAFDDAVRHGRLSHDGDSPLNVGAFMYMGTTMGTHKDLFKHRLTRLYLPQEGTTLELEEWARRAEEVRMTS